MALLRIRDEKRLHTTKCLIRESIVKHTALTSMRLNIGDIPSVRDLATVRPRAVVRLGLDDIPLVAEDSLMGGRRVHDHGIRAIAEYGSFWEESQSQPISSVLLVERTILLLQSQKPDMAVLLCRVPKRGEIRHFRPEGTGVFG